MTEELRRVTIFGQIFINVSVEWLGTPIPFYDTVGVPWVYNILIPELRWEDGDSYQVWSSETHYRPQFGEKIVPWRGTVPFRPNYLPSSSENVCARARRICGVRLRENRLARDQTLLHDLHFGGDERGNRPDDSLVVWVDQ